MFNREEYDVICGLPPRYRSGVKFVVYSNIEMRTYRSKDLGINSKQGDNRSRILHLNYKSLCIQLYFLLLAISSTLCLFWAISGSLEQLWNPGGVLAVIRDAPWKRSQLTTRISNYCMQERRFYLRPDRTNASCERSSGTLCKFIYSLDLRDGIWFHIFTISTRDIMVWNAKIQILTHKY